MRDILNSVQAHFYTKADLRDAPRTLDLIRFVVGHGAAYEPWSWHAKRATRGREQRFLLARLGKLAADLVDPDATLVDFFREPLGPYQLFLSWGMRLASDPQFRATSHLLLRLPYEHFQGADAREHVEEYLAVLRGIYERTGAYYGYAHETRDHDTLTTVHTPNRSSPRTDADAPALFWANFLGPDLAQAIGRERLEQAAYWRRESLSDGGLLLVFSPNPLDFESSRAERARLYRAWELERLTKPQPRARPAQALPGPEPVVESVARCRELAQVCVQTARQVSGVELDYSEASLSHLDRIIGEGWSVGQTPDGVILVMGCYLGETTIRQLGGEWSWQDQGPGLTRPYVQRGQVSLNVIGKVKKRFQYGESDSLAWFFEMARARSPAGDGA